MLHILSLIAPIFGLIAIGFVAAKSRYLSAGGARFVSELGYKVVMPALLFRAMLSVGEIPVSPLWLVATYTSAVFTAWILATLTARLILRRPAADAPSIAMGVCFSNGVMLGFPIILAAFGPDAATPIAFLATCETLFLWLVGTLHMEIASRGARGFSWRSLGGALVEVAINPLILAMAAGLACRFGGVTVPDQPAKFIGLLAQAAVPVSLLGLGMALAGYEIKGQAPTIVSIISIKMVVYPAIAFVLATEVFALPPIWAGALVTYVSMPVGANAFLFAARYDKAVASVSAAVAISTVLAVVSTTIVLAGLNAYGLVPR